MKATLTITSRAVVTLPAKLRQALGLMADDQPIAETTSAGFAAAVLPSRCRSSFTPPERVREFDATEAEMAAVLECKAQRRPAVRKTARHAAR